MSSNGARITLVARGVQDVYLMGEPNSTFFKQTYKRHTNFSMAVITQIIEGAVSGGGRSTIDIGRNADLLSYIYLYQTNDIGEQSVKYIDKVQLTVGGQVICEMTQGELFIWEAFMANSQTKMESGLSGPYNRCVQALHFWFCDSWGSSLPLCALQNTSVKLNIFWKAGAEDFNWVCRANYIFLDNMERKKFVEAPKLEYLIHQWQRTSPILLTETRVPLEFNNPVLSLFLTGVDYTTSINMFKSMKIVANGNEIASGRMIDFAKSGFWHASNAGLALTRMMIPFCLNVASCNPSGSVNFSRLDEVTLVFEDGNPLVATTTYDLDNIVHAVSWNVFKIEKGMGGLNFSS